MIAGLWAIAALILVVLEMLTIDFTFLMLAGGAVGALITAFITDSWAIQLGVFAAISILLLIFVRPLIRRHFMSTDSQATNVYGLVGKNATAITDISESSGRAKVGGDVWSAKTDTGTISAGEKAIVSAIEGVQLVLKVH